MILKHKNRELLHFDWIRPFGVKNIELVSRDKQYLPLDFRDQAERGVSRNLVWALEDWLMHRTAPMNRRFVRDFLVSTGFNPNDPRYLCRLIEFCKGLSLNDAYWVVPDDFDGSWEDGNLYRNDFPASVAALAFSGMGNVRPHDVSTSPEYTTDGVLAKCWRRRDGEIALWKAGSEKSHGLEPFAEFYAYQVAEALGIEHVPYRLARYKNRLCSVCPLFTSEDLGFVPAGRLMTREQIANDDRFADLFLLDAVILNDDRHLGNFGFLVDNEVNEICGVAPAFDNGHAFFSRTAARFPEGSPALYENWCDFPGMDGRRALDRLSRMRGFRLKKDSRFNLPDLAFRAASTFLERRVDQLVKIFSKSSPGGPVKVGFTGPADLLRLVRDNPGLRKNVLSKLAGLSERTVKRYLSQLSDKVEFRGSPKTGGYYVKMNFRASE